MTKPPSDPHVGRCRAYPFCRKECQAYEEEAPKSLNLHGRLYGYCTCGHTQGVHELPKEET